MHPPHGSTLDVAPPTPDQRTSSSPSGRRWALERGASLREDGAVHFAVWAPAAKQLSVRVLSGAASGIHALERDEQGVHQATVAGVGAGADYKYVLTTEDGGQQEVPDPVSRWQPEGVHGPSRVVDPRAFGWTDHAWRGIGMPELVLYELHVGTFTAEGTFDAVIPRLAELCALGITAIELMPVAEFPGARNWGYDGVALYAPQSSYGGPDALRRLVDAAHEVGLAVVLDVVYNHLGPEGNYLGAFGPYFTETYRTPWGSAVNYDGPDSDEVRRFVVDNARYWASEFHVDGLRLDAVHGIFDFGAKHLLQELTAEVHAVGADANRRVVVIAESDLNDPRLVRATSDGGYGLDGQWSDDFHHAVHAALTGERKGYYRDFAEPRMIADSLREPFVYAGRYSAHRRRRHGAPATGIPRERFVVAIQNHDQVGNRATGDRLTATLQQDQLRLAAALLLLSGYVPLLFMGEEYGERNPFQYFVSHGDEALVKAVREGRRREFEAFGWGDDVPDPQDESTFAASRLDWSRRDEDGHRQLLALYRDLLRVRHQEPALRPGGGSLEVSGDGACIRVLYHPRHEGGYMQGLPLLGFFNCGPEAATDHALGGKWRLLLSTDDEVYGGHGSTTPVIGHHGEGQRRQLDANALRVTLPPWSAALYLRDE